MQLESFVLHEPRQTGNIFFLRSSKKLTVTFLGEQADWISSNSRRYAK